MKDYGWIFLFKCQIDQIQVLSSEVKINANSVWGALRGLETFSQLTFITKDGKVMNNLIQLSMLITKLNKNL